MAREVFKKECVICDAPFETICDTQPCCSKECKKMFKIKQSNELWMNRTPVKRSRTFNQGYGIL